MAVKVMSPALFSELEEVRYLTEQIRDHQRRIEEIAEERRQHILNLRSGRITYREIASSMRVTEQSVYKCLKPVFEAERALAVEEALALEEATQEPAS
jgi:DNA invertase Pin-like site-specific DNA recombinase